VTADRFCRWAIELLLLGLCLAAPWALGGTLPEAVLGLQIGTALVLVLWAARAVVTGSLPWRGDLPLAALGGLTLLAALQLVPVPAAALRVVSPGTLRTNEFLRPAVGEALPGEGPGAARPAAFPVSLSPPHTREFFAQVFALTLLYAAARSNLTGPGPLARLAWACAVNGALLCLLGIAQRLSSPPNVIYWSIPVENTAFGPFVNRNHLAFYANVCLGLGGALLAGRLRDGPGEVLARPSALWLVVLVGVTAVGVAYSQSRGGVAAALAAGAACLAVWFGSARRAGGLGWLPWAALAAVAVGSWLGWGPLTARLGALDVDRAAEDGRVEMWAASLQLAAGYPAFGTGAGTYDWVEPGTRTRPGLEEWSAEYAHNEYVEGAVEGGAVRLGLTLLLVAAPVVRVVRRYRQTAGRPGAELLLGGLFGFLAVALHSVTDFGVHLPAVAVLAAVHLAALMAAADREGPPGGLRPAPAAGLAGLGLAAAGALVAWDGWTADRAERARAATAGLAADRPLTAAQADRAVRLLAAACEARPGNALYRHELGQAHLARALTRPPESAEQAADLRAALGHWRAARDLSPVMAPTHARLGRYRDRFATADPPLAYFERARHLLPTDATMIYYCGQARWAAGDVSGACADWRASLSSSDLHLAEILALARGRLTPAEVLRDVLPGDRPATTLKAADALFPDGGADHPGRRAYLEAARDRLAARDAKSAAEWELEARLEAGLGRPDRAAAAYRRALGLAPRQVPWRLAYAEVLRQTGALKDARRELETAVAQDPNNRPARDQLEVVRRELRLKGEE
jgi:tetratricopeptide (TPR) repeat protein